MNLIKYLTFLKKLAESQGKTSPTAIEIVSPLVRVNRFERRKTAQQAHDHSEKGTRKPRNYRRQLKARRKLGRH